MFQRKGCIIILFTRIDNFKTKDIVEFWNHNIGRDFPMTTELYEQNTGRNEFVCKESSVVATNDMGRIIGIIVAKKNTETDYVEFSKTVGWIQFLIVDQSSRKQGIGSTLLSYAENKLKKEGIKKIFLGKDPYHYFPGVPSQYYEVSRWFKERGYVYNRKEYDLKNKYLKNEENNKPTHQDILFTRLKYSERNEFIEFMEKEFPGRWVFELKEYFINGGRGREFIIGKKNDSIIGFCRINDSSSPLIAQNIYWSQLFNEKLGGIGPLGLAASERGLGYGLLIVEAGIYFLRTRNINQIVIDWTTLTDFYGKLGYIPWKVYDTYSKSI